MALSDNPIRGEVPAGIRHFAGKKSSEQLAFIDDLHKLGLDKWIELPQLVVVGDQNTGKSSVLQAITELPFPVNESMCTRFPTEVVFRRAKPDEKTVVKATIRSNKTSKQDPNLRDRIKDFALTYDELSPQVMEDIIDQATACVFGLDIHTKDKLRLDIGLSDATLRIERSGPHEQHWSIVDLPGLIQGKKTVNIQADSSAKQVNGLSHNGDTGDRRDHIPTKTSPSKKKSDITVAKDLVRAYMENERSIILAVIDPTDYQRQSIFSMIEEIPGSSNRMIGVITKCDTKQEGSDTWVTNFLKNREGSSPCYLKHGWFALRNRKPKEIHITNEERDSLEETEFRKPDWSEVPKSKTGIAALMSYVDRERNNQLQSNMPKLLDEIRMRLRTCSSELRQMGEVRDSPQTQRLFLTQLSDNLKTMADSALDGRYESKVFDNAESKVRLNIQTRLDEFAKEMHRPNDKLPIPFCSTALDSEFIGNLKADSWQEEILRSSNIYGKILRESKRFRGTDLPGDINGSVIKYLFREQSSLWSEAAFRLLQDVQHLVIQARDNLFSAACPDESTRTRVRQSIKSKLEEWDKDAETCLQDLIADNQERHLVTHNPHFLEFPKGTAELRMKAITATMLQNFQVKTKKHLKANSMSTPADTMTIATKYVDELADPSNFLNQESELLVSTSTQMDRLFQIHDYLESYYFLALNRFVDNVAMQVVERHVLGPKCPIRAFSSERVGRLTDEELQDLAGEDAEKRQRRSELTEQKAMFKEALERWEQIQRL